VSSLRVNVPTFPASLLAPLDLPDRFDELSLIAAAIESSQSPMIVTNPCQWDNPIVSSNRSFLELTGYEANFVNDRNCRFLQGDDTCPVALGEIRSALDAEQDFTITLLNYRKDGEPFWNVLRVAHIFNAAGELAYHLGSQQSVTVDSSRTLAQTADWNAEETLTITQLRAIMLHDQYDTPDIMAQLRNPSADSPTGYR
jgi:PAS domain S-box-containing protein